MSLILQKKKKFTKYDNKLKVLLRAAKNKFEEQKLKNADTKSLWKFVHKKLDSKSKKQGIDDIIVNGQVCNQDSLKANHFNQYFCNVVDTLSNSSIPPIHSHEIPNIPLNTQTMFLNPTSETEVLQTILNLKQKSGGNDGIHAFVLKLAAPFIASVLAQIINNIMVQGTCPQQFKAAEVCPVFKKGSKKDMNNYIPIALIHTYSPDTYL